MLNPLEIQNEVGKIQDLSPREAELASLVMSLCDCIILIQGDIFLLQQQFPPEVQVKLRHV